MRECDLVFRRARRLVCRRERRSAHEFGKVEKEVEMDEGTRGRGLESELVMMAVAVMMVQRYWPWRRWVR
jgi:hypothetical protein